MNFYSLVTFWSFSFLTSFAAQASGWQCFTTPTTSSISGLESKDSLDIAIIHHNGVRYMPIHSGVITPNDIDYLKSRGEVLKKLGDEIHLSFPLSNCKSYGDWKMSCYSRTPTKIGELKIDSASLISSTSTRELLGYQFHQIEMNLSVRVGRFNYDIPLEYQASDCKK